MEKEKLDKTTKYEVSPKRNVDKEWYLSLLDDDKQFSYEENHLRYVLRALKLLFIAKEKDAILEAEKELKEIRENDSSALGYQRTLQLGAEIEIYKNNIEGYRHFFEEPYFARMDVLDEKEGYNSYYIGKKGELDMGIVDWRAPLSRRYYQKSQRSFTINEYDYSVILRRAIRTSGGKVLDFKNEHLSVRDFLTKEEIGGRDEEIVLDPYLRDIIRARKDEESVRDIIETIQEKQFDLITRPPEENFVLQGCAGSGKTMVLLHRLSYLMYNDYGITPRDVMIITPSRSFNAFIDELAQVLELEKVRTVTLQDYFVQVLEKADVPIADKFNGEKEDEKYLAYLYSKDYSSDVKKTLSKVFDGVYGMFASEECKDYAASVLAECRRQNEEYAKIKNASLRVRRAVLGEIKEREEGGVFYTKPFREFMNDVLQIQDFLSAGVEEGLTKSQAYFYKQLRLFIHSGIRVATKAQTVCDDALSSLASLREDVKKEIRDLERYKIKVAGKDEYTYFDRIENRKSILSEIEVISRVIEDMKDGNTDFAEFFKVLTGEKHLFELGSAESTLDTARFFYKLIVKKQKQKYNMTAKGLYPSDAYALLTIMAELGQDLYPHYRYVFIDEGQDISAEEYALLRRINKDSSFNVYGDLKQNVTPYRGVKSWEETGIENVYYLSQNYRNTNQIVSFVQGYMDLDMEPIGFDGEKVRTIRKKGISAFFKEAKGLCAIITAESELSAFKRGSYNVVRETGKVSKKKINLLSVYESKGLEFGSVVVYEGGMSENEKYIAFTRALNRLAVIKEEEDG